MTFVSLRFGYNQTEDDVYHHRGAYGSQRQQHVDDANHRRVQPQVFAQASTHAANHAPLARPGKSFEHIRRNLVGDRLSRACKPDSASAVPKLHLPPQFIAKIEQSKGKNKIAPPSFYKKRGSLLLPANREVLPVSAGEGSASGAVGSMLVDTNREVADK